MRHPVRAVFRRRAFGSFLVAFAVSLGAAVPTADLTLRLYRPAVPAQAQQSAQPQRPTFRVEANFVRVDVFATAGEQPVLDLRQEELLVFEDGTPQKIESFEHVIVRPAGSQAARVEPNTLREANVMAADPHTRVFVVFLDTNHVSLDGSSNIARPLVQLLDRILGADDLVGLMTPHMSASELTLARKTEVVERGLRENWFWGRRNRVTALDAVEDSYVLCYPPGPGDGGPVSAVAREMIARRREKMTLDAVQDLVRHLNGLRDERKAIITVSEGWTLYGPYSPLLIGAPPSLPQVYVSPRGTLTTKDERAPGGGTQAECDRDRLMLADLDDQRYFREIVTEADRSNASFYPVDPRGLVAFDTQLGGLEQPLTPGADLAQLRAREQALRTLAVATSGLAVLGSNDIERGLRTVANALSSYYLLGYYSTNATLDGKYRRIDVKITRPGVSVRARRGYRAVLEEEFAKAASPEHLAADSPRAFEAVLSRELSTLAGARPNAPLHLRGVLVPGERGMTLWVAGELGDTLVRSPGWSSVSRQGADVRIMVSGNRGETLGAGRVGLEMGVRSFVTKLTLERAPGVGEVRVQAQIGGSAADGERAGAGLALPMPEAGVHAPVWSPLLYRAAPGATGVFEPVAFPQFRRAEIFRAEAPLDAEASGLSARLLDRAGHLLPVPVAVTDRRDGATGQRWLVADVGLAPLTAGEYVVAVSAQRDGARHEVLTAFRVVR